MAASGVVTDTKRKRVCQLIRDGKGRNEIAREVGLALATITGIARDAGLSFDRSATAAATAARQADLAAMRYKTAIELHEMGDKLLAQVFQPHTVWAFGGKDNTYAEEHHPEPPPAEKKSLVQAAATAFDRSLKMAPPEDATGVDEARSMLGDLGKAITELSQAADDEPVEGDEA
ncbi:hypothetical protein [Streptomyces sp. NPDC059649]|uniref:hypothetical protein n=1 Tax=Streptomyces sp. NPDC059649 TaxID=3346895 RepID=UPI003699D855